jgi:hypothetical protein
MEKQELDLINRITLLSQLAESASHHAQNEREYQLMLRDRNIVREQLSILAIPIPKDSKNIDVVKAVFPDLFSYEFYTVTHSDTLLISNRGKNKTQKDFWQEWLNAPYKGGEK